MKRAAGLVRVMMMIFISGLGYAQVHEDFGDGNFSHNPHWQGDSAQFAINTSGQLQLAGSGTDTAGLSVPNLLVDSTVWTFWIRLAFSPSSNNFARVYLVSNQAKLDEPLQGYFLQFGQAGSNDAIVFYRQDGLDTFRICTGSPGLIASAFSLGIKVSRDLQGYWEIFADPGGGQQYQSEATGFDTIFRQTLFFGIQCRYTASNATKFYFDDIEIHYKQVDNIPPQLIRLVARDSLSLDVFLSEPIHSLTAENPLNYSVDKGIGQAMLAVPDLYQAGLVHLQFLNPFKEDSAYTLLIGEIRDIAGNSAYNLSSDFYFHRIRQHDLVFNEIMFDPDPQAGLPPYEYLEVYNRTDSPVFLKDWQYSWANSKVILPDTMVRPRSFLLFCNKGDGIFMASNGNYIEINGFALPNAGGSLLLRDPNGLAISWAEYSPEWIENPLKKEGGWALEQVDPMNPCGGKANWKESMAARGGTPGKKNSVDTPQPDLGLPHAVRAYPITPSRIMLLFSESLDSVSLLQDDMFRLEPGHRVPLAVILRPPGYSQVELIFADSIEPERTYVLQILLAVRDCAGNSSFEADSLKIAIPGYPGITDIVINEVMFNPGSQGAEFAELYNLSNKALDLKDLVIGTYDSISKSFESFGKAMDESYLIFPGDYVVLTDDPLAVLQDHHSENPSAVIRSSFFPTLSNEGGMLAIADISLQFIDKVTFLAEMHYPLLTTTAGVSLEKLRPDMNSALKASWHSAAASCGYATPAYRNSQFIDMVDSENAFSLEPRVFAPGNDGMNDLLTLAYKLADPGYMLNVTIFNEAGFVAKTLVNNELLGTRGFFTWDGLNDRQILCSPGNYICYIEIFNRDGNVKKIKKVFGIVWE